MVTFCFMAVLHSVPISFDGCCTGGHGLQFETDLKYTIIKPDDMTWTPLIF